MRISRYVVSRTAIVFQSAPGREAGRCVRRATGTWQSRTFQSAPGREAGRCAGVVVVGLRDIDVSIRARP